MIRAIWLFPAMVVFACDREVPNVGDPNNIIVNGEKMSQTDFLNKYCIEKEDDPICSEVLDAATINIIDRVRGPNKRRMN